MEKIIWPVYIDSTKSRKEGRRVNKKIAISSPELTEIAKAARKLNLKPKIQEYKSYPGLWWENSGRIIIETENNKKNEILSEISNVIQNLRE